ncbi:MAG: ABC transporter ATP-binding protein/permease [Ruminococcus sp.]|nr:ABC transporter ATP-binding protein/permease [Ruminococcus sp.]
MFQVKWMWENLRGYRARYIIAMILSVAINGLELATPILSALIVDNFISAENAVENVKNQRGYLIFLLVAIVLFTVLKSITRYVCCMSYEHASQGAIYRIRSKLFRNVQNQDISFYDSYRTGDLMTRLTGDLDMVRHMLAFVFRGLIESSTLLLAAVVYFFVIDWKMAISILALTPLIFIISVRLKKVAGPVHMKAREKLSAINTAAQENISGNRVVKAFAREDYEIEKFNKISEEYAEANKKASLKWLNYSPFLEGIALCLSAVMLLCGGLFLIFDQITMGEYIAVSGLVWAVSNPMKNLGMYVNDTQRFMASAMKIIDIYYKKPTIKTPENAYEPSSVNGDIEFKNVSFRYDGADVLKDVTFRINHGETVAVMGETGSGKTTLVNLIPRFYDVSKGSVSVDGVDVKNYSLKSLRGSISMATQDVFLYSDTIDGNIAYGDSDLPEQEVEEYASLACATEFIEKMPEGYDTIIGERGVGLSGGQKQRISLARAMAVRPSILILDDTTSAVDMETESYIQNSLKSLDYDCTKIIIAQRISSAKDADKIIVLDDGKIKEMGTHQELLKKKGYYYDVFMLQNEGFERGEK